MSFFERLVGSGSSPGSNLCAPSSNSLVSLCSPPACRTSQGVNSSRIFDGGLAQLCVMKSQELLSASLLKDSSRTIGKLKHGPFESQQERMPKPRVCLHQAKQQGGWVEHILCRGGRACGYSQGSCSCSPLSLFSEGCILSVLACFFSQKARCSSRP